MNKNTSADIEQLFTILRDPFFISWKKVEKIIQANPSILHDEKQGIYILHEICKRRPDLSTVMLILQEFPKAARIQDNHGCLPIHLACEFDASFDVVELLMYEYNNSIRSINRYGMLPLHIACAVGHSAKVVDLLLQFFPEGVEYLDDSKTTPEQYVKALENEVKKREILAVLQKSTAYETVAKSSSWQIVKRVAIVAGQMDGIDISEEEATMAAELFTLNLSKFRSDEHTNEDMANELLTLLQSHFDKFKSNIKKERRHASEKIALQTQALHHTKKAIAEMEDELTKVKSRNTALEEELKRNVNTILQMEKNVSMENKHLTDKNDKLSHELKMKEKKEVDLIDRIENLEQTLETIQESITGSSDERSYVSSRSASSLSATNRRLGTRSESPVISRPNRFGNLDTIQSYDTMSTASTIKPPHGRVSSSTSGSMSSVAENRVPSATEKYAGARSRYIIEEMKRGSNSSPYSSGTRSAEKHTHSKERYDITSSSASVSSTRSSVSRYLSSLKSEVNGYSSPSPPPPPPVPPPVPPPSYVSTRHSPMRDNSSITSRLTTSSRLSSARYQDDKYDVNRTTSSRYSQDSSYHHTGDKYRQTSTDLRTMDEAENDDYLDEANNENNYRPESTSRTTRSNSLTSMTPLSTSRKYDLERNKKIRNFRISKMKSSNSNDNNSHIPNTITMNDSSSSTEHEVGKGSWYISQRRF